MEADAGACDNCCGYPFKMVEPTEQRFNKTNDSTPGTKITAVTAATKNSGPLSRMTLESTRIQPFQTPSKKHTAMHQSVSTADLKQRAISPELFRAQDLQIQRKRMDCRILQQRYQNKERAYAEKLVMLRREFLMLINNYKQKLAALDIVQRKMAEFERGRPTGRFSSATPMRSVSMVQVRR